MSVLKEVVEVTNFQIEPDVDLRREQPELRRVTYRKKLTSFALAAAIVLAAVACDGGSRGGMRPNEAKPPNESPTMFPETPSGASFLDPLTDEQPVRVFEVEADHGQYWRMFTLDRYPEPDLPDPQ